MTEDENEALGWQAIDAALAPIYGSAEPTRHFAAMPPASMGGPPLQGISVYRNEREAPHWHFVTYGFTELYGKEFKSAQQSGFGFELTFRLRRSTEETEPPPWAVNLLQNLGRYVFQKGNGFSAGQHMSLRGPIALGSDTLIHALLFVSDPELGAAESPNGRFSFLQAVGVTEDELKAIERWSGAGMAEVIGRLSPAYLTDLARHSYLDDAIVSRAVGEHTEREGSSFGASFVSRVEWQVHKSFLRSPRLHVFLGATAVETLQNGLQSRTRLQRPFTLIGSGSAHARLRLETGDAPGWSTDGDLLRITLNEAARDELSTLLRPQRGTVRVPLLPRVEWCVEPSDIKDSTGRVLHTLG